MVLLGEGHGLDSGLSLTFIILASWHPCEGTVLVLIDRLKKTKCREVGYLSHSPGTASCGIVIHADPAARGT